MLYIVATPIGNLEDITHRALRILQEVDLILAEDTRITKRLLDRYDPEITVKKTKDQIADLIKQGKNLALVTDAGTPGISDPGNKLIHDLIQKFNNDLQVIPIPGPSALTAALSVSGFPTDKFTFLGFIPHKNGRNKFLKTALESKHTVIFYESCHRIIRCLEQIKEIGETGRQIMVGHELTKKFEKTYRGTLDNIREKVQDDPIKGEYVVVIKDIKKIKSI